MKKFIITIIIVLVVVLGVFILRGSEDRWMCVNGEWVKHGVPSAPMPSQPCDEDSRVCIVDADCVVFGQTGDCNCGCYHKDNLPTAIGGKCFCAAPTSCRCVNSKCQGVFDDGLSVNDFESCAAAGNAVMESYPRKCRDKDGNEFVEDIGNELEKTDLIRIDNPRPNQKITSPLNIEGQARGYWFFEGDFPVDLVDWDGQIIAQGVATAQGEWMTEDFVVFKASLDFTAPDTSVSNKGTLILKRDNPSGLPANDDALEVPVKF